MRPFLSLSLPEVPSYEELSFLILIPSSESTRSGVGASEDDPHEQALSMLDVAERAIKRARREWDALSKLSAEAGRCQGCEEWWKSSIRDILRASIAGSIAVATTRKGLVGSKGKHMTDVLQVEIADAAKRYHTWWVVPTISLR